jgi:hypothetical protein
VIGRARAAGGTAVSGGISSGLARRQAAPAEPQLLAARASSPLHLGIISSFRSPAPIRAWRAGNLAEHDAGRVWRFRSGAGGIVAPAFGPGRETLPGTPAAARQCPDPAEVDMRPVDYDWPTWPGLENFLDARIAARP